MQDIKTMIFNFENLDPYEIAGQVFITTMPKTPNDKSALKPSLSKGSYISIAFARFKILLVKWLSLHSFTSWY